MKSLTGPKRRILLSAGIAAFFGALVGAFMLYMAFDHNPQGEFYSYEGFIVWDAVLPVFILPFLLVGCFVFVMCLAATFIADLFVSRK